MLLTILLIFAVILVVLVMVVATRPADFRITRSAVMPVPADAVFKQVNDFHCWNSWSPWAKIDPNVKKAFEGPSSGPGAIFRWAGNNEVGQGAMTILENQPGKLIRIKLEFLKPFQATNTAEFTFQPQGDQTVVTWSMTGKNGFIAKAFNLVVNCDKMVGSQFEKGLENLKIASQSSTIL